MTLISDITSEFMKGFNEPPAVKNLPLKRKEKQLRANLSDKQVDRMVEQTFPASDPPSTY